MSLFNKLLIVGGFCAILATFIFGCEFGKTRVRCPQITNDTIVLHDTSWHVIYDTTYYASKPDTIYNTDTVYKDADTTAILKDYFLKRGFKWEKKDSNIIVNGYSIIAENKLLSTNIKYKWLKPTTTTITNVDNSTHYNKYIYGGLGIPFKDFNYINLELTYAFPKGYVSGYWIPELKSFGAKAGVTLFKFE